MILPEPAPSPLHCSLCKEPLSEPRFYAHVIGRTIYHQHCADEIARSRADILGVPLTVAKTLVKAPLPWHLLDCGIRVDWRYVWWGCFWDRNDVRLYLTICLSPFVPLRLVLGPRLRHAGPILD